jgi:hypothetical protein
MHVPPPKILFAGIFRPSSVGVADTRGTYPTNGSIHGTFEPS